MQLHGTARINAAGHLEIGGCDVTELAASYGTPLYIMDENLIRENARAYRMALERHYAGDGLVLYAAKAFLCQAMALLAVAEGLGLDAVSGGEMYTMLEAGVPPELIYFHGNNKSEDEIRLALESGIGRIVADGENDIERIAAVAARLGRTADMLLRVTPGVNTDTHSYIRTGQLDSKFGEPLYGDRAKAAVKAALARPSVRLVGLHCHLGSQLLSVAPFEQAVGLLVRFAAELRQEYGWEMYELNIGGGLGVRYMPADKPPAIETVVATIAKAVQTETARAGLPLPALRLEPGRSIVAEAGTTLYTVGTIKHIPGIRTYVAVDGGMYENPRPALYQARHEALLANRAHDPASQTAAIVGKCCETGDILIEQAAIAPPQSGDLLAVSTTGAYNYAMASNYNRLPRPAVVFVQDGQADIVVARETYADLVQHDQVPLRLAPTTIATGSHRR